MFTVLTRKASFEAGRLVRSDIFRLEPKQRFFAENVSWAAPTALSQTVRFARIRVVCVPQGRPKQPHWSRAFVRALRLYLVGNYGYFQPEPRVCRASLKVFQITFSICVYTTESIGKDG